MCEFSVHYVALTEKYGRPIYHYHLHVVALLVVEKQIKRSKRCKDKALVGTVKETVMQVSHSKKWKLPQLTDENGVPQFMQTANQYSFQPIAFCKEIYLINLALQICLRQNILSAILKNMQND